MALEIPLRKSSLGRVFYFWGHLFEINWALTYIHTYIHTYIPFSAWCPLKSWNSLCQKYECFHEVCGIYFHVIMLQYGIYFVHWFITPKIHWLKCGFELVKDGFLKLKFKIRVLHFIKIHVSSHILEISVLEGTLKSNNVYLKNWKKAGLAGKRELELKQKSAKNFFLPC